MTIKKKDSKEREFQEDLRKQNFRFNRRVVMMKEVAKEIENLESTKVCRPKKANSSSIDGTQHGLAVAPINSPSHESMLLHYHGFDDDNWMLEYYNDSVSIEDGTNDNVAAKIVSSDDIMLPDICGFDNDNWILDYYKVLVPGKDDTNDMDTRELTVEDYVNLVLVENNQSLHDNVWNNNMINEALQQSSDILPSDSPSLRPLAFNNDLLGNLDWIPDSYTDSMINSDNGAFTSLTDMLWSDDDFFPGESNNGFPLGNSGCGSFTDNLNFSQPQQLQSILPGALPGENSNDNLLPQSGTR